MEIFHKWGKWICYDHETLYVKVDGGEVKKDLVKTEKRQYRICERCGLTEDIPQFGRGKRK